MIPRECVPGTGYIIRAYWRLQEFALMQLSGVCFMQVNRVVQLSQISAQSSVPMSPNRVCEDYTYDTVDVFPVFQVSQDATEYTYL